MVSTALFAPAHRVLARLASGASGFPATAGPSIDFLGVGVQDHRLPYNRRGSSAVQPAVLGWYGAGDTMVANLVPAVAATANIAALQNVVTGAALTLAAASGSGIIALSASAPAQFFANPVAIRSGVAIDALPSYHVFGATATRGGSAGFYSRSTNVGRCVSISGVVSGTGGNFLVAGYDIYGFPMTQLVTVAAGANTVNTTKAFKLVTSVTPQFTDAHTYSVGVSDIFGIGIMAAFWGDLLVYWNNALLTANTGFTAAVTTSPATSTTGDVRGTYAVQSASDGTKRLQIIVRPSIGAMLTNPTTGLFGVAQA